MSNKTETQKLQKIADEKFGKGEITIVFERFAGFYAQFSHDYGCGSAFLGNSIQAERKLNARNFNLK